MMEKVSQGTISLLFAVVFFHTMVSMDENQVSVPKTTTTLSGICLPDVWAIVTYNGASNTYSGTSYFYSNTTHPNGLSKQPSHGTELTSAAAQKYYQQLLREFTAAKKARLPNGIRIS
jgi:hypothetical protein